MKDVDEGLGGTHCSLLSARRCCQAGCTATIDIASLPSDWYKSSWGFMSWACPEHAVQWRDFNVKNREYEQRHGEAYSEAMSKFEEEWERDYESKFPRPEPPSSQASI
jgi:hypothetical protein